jgi:hypothetical protein
MIDLIKRVSRSGLVILLALSALSALYEWKQFPVSILLGGVLGLLNLKGLAWGLRDFAQYRPSGKVIFLSLLRFFLMAVILISLVVARKIHPVGVLIGFTVVFALIIREGLRMAKGSSKNDG